MKRMAALLSITFLSFSAGAQTNDPQGVALVASGLELLTPTVRTLREHSLLRQQRRNDVCDRVPTTFQPFSTFESRIMRGLDPVQRLKARENAAGSENPTK